MKYINFPVTVVKETWKRKAERASLLAAEKSGKECGEYISSRSSVWSELKPDLEALSDGKCWYTEAKDKVSYWQVDHYRPKSIYPWLAFDWRNMRLAGAVPNISKLNNFPLAEEASRATFGNPSIVNEAPLLLDPTQWGDPDLLSFNGNGEAACALPTNEKAQRRVAETVRILELNSEKLCAGRREKWRLCERKLKALRKIVEDQRHQDNSDAVTHLEELCKDLDQLYADQSEFTATAWACARELNAETIVRLAKQLAQATA